jgi:hypothetical protein
MILIKLEMFYCHFFIIPYNILKSVKNEHINCLFLNKDQ